MIDGDAVNESSPARRSVLISYAHEDPDHVDAVARLHALLCEAGLGAVVDTAEVRSRRDWVAWTCDQIATADRVVVVASPRYRARFEGNVLPNEGAGAQLEGVLIRNDLQRDWKLGQMKYFPVLLPGRRPEDVPQVFAPYSMTLYRVEQLTPDGVRELALALTTDGTVSTSEPRITGPALAAWFGVSGGTPEERAAALLVPAERGIGSATADEGSCPDESGIVAVGDSDDIAACFEELLHAIRDVAEGSVPCGGRRPLQVVVGVAHAGSEGEATAEARTLATGVVAQQIRQVPQARVGVVASLSAHGALVGVPRPFPVAAAYRRIDRPGSRGGGVFAAILGRAVCPVIRFRPLEPTTTSKMDDGGPSEVHSNWRVVVRGGTNVNAAGDAHVNIRNER